MYCPRCNLHSEEYVDQCPLCDGPMEVDEDTNELVKPPQQTTRAQTEKSTGKDPLKNDNQQINWDGPATVAIDQDLISQEMNETGIQTDSDDFSFPIAEKRQPEDDPAVLAASSDNASGKDSAAPEHKTRTSLLMLLGIVVMAAAGYFFFSADEKQTIQLDATSTTVSPHASVAPSEHASPGESPAPTTAAPVNENSSTPGLMTQSESMPANETGPRQNGALVPAPLPESATEPPTSQPQSPSPSEEKAQQLIPAETGSIGSSSATDPPSSLPEPSTQGSYAIHVGSFKIESRAEELKQQLIQKGYPASTTLVNLPDKGDWYRVMIGSYSTRDDAALVADRLAKNENVPTLIMHR
ncbi:MAG TPA: SPOR domain-containing protein, partial [Thermodesulfobacteriota bacterium]|nr:SPOR domain-containing protein [Thermodesulfobacteriota bacterium]